MSSLAKVMLAVRTLESLWGTALVSVMADHVAAMLVAATAIWTRMTIGIVVVVTLLGESMQGPRLQWSV